MIVTVPAKSIGPFAMPRHASSSRSLTLQASESSEVSSNNTHRGRMRKQGTMQETAKETVKEMAPETIKGSKRNAKSQLAHAQPVTQGTAKKQWLASKTQEAFNPFTPELPIEGATLEALPKEPRPHAKRKNKQSEQALPTEALPVAALTPIEVLKPLDIQTRPTTGRHKRFPCQRVSDLDPRAWRELSSDLLLSSLWLFQGRSREDGHRNIYHGNCIPQIVYQLLRRYTRTGDTILDCFLGSGTSLIEAYRLGRFGLGLELQPSVAEETHRHLGGLGACERRWQVACGNSQDAHWVKQRVAQFLEHCNESPTDVKAPSASKVSKKAPKEALGQHTRQHVDFLFLHPPYDDIIRFSEHPDDLSAQSSTQDFLTAFNDVLKASVPTLKPGGFAAIVIGDKYTAGTWLPLGFWCMNLATQQHDLALKAIIVKNITGNERGKGRTGNLWKYRAVAGGFYLFEHEYIFILEKPLKNP
jgi:DNA modification methylase